MPDEPFVEMPDAELNSIAELVYASVAPCPASAVIVRDLIANLRHARLLTERIATTFGHGYLAGDMPSVFAVAEMMSAAGYDEDRCVALALAALHQYYPEDEEPTDDR